MTELCRDGIELLATFFKFGRPRDAGVVIDGDHPHWRGCQDLAHDVGVPQAVDRDLCWIYAGSGRRSLKRMISLFQEDDKGRASAAWISLRF